MLISTLDPALVFYKYEDWKTRQPHCLSRLEALTLHRRKTRAHNLEIVLSSDLASLMYNAFPWSEGFRSVPEIRDLRTFLLEDLTYVARYIDASQEGDVELQGAESLCRHVESADVLSAWVNLLHSSIEELDPEVYDPQIATWDSTPVLDRSEIQIAVCNRTSSTETYSIPLVWDENSWANRLATQECWPDLQLCIELEFGTNGSIRTYSRVRKHPLPFECTDGFWGSLDRYCKQPQLRRSLVTALTKRVYGVLNASLGDEPFRDMRRFRVTDYWRVHYRLEGDVLVLEEFGPHGMGGVS